MFCDVPPSPQKNPIECAAYKPGHWDQDIYTIPFGALLVTAVSRIDPPETPRWPFNTETAYENRHPTRHPGVFAGALAGVTFVPLLGSVLTDKPEFPISKHLRGLIHSHLWTELLTSGAKVFFGRKRPFFDTAAREGKAGRDDRLSFFSGHSSHSFAFATYASQLAFHELKNESLSWTYAVALYSTAAWIASSRAVDKQHNWSDVLTGASVGTVAGYLVHQRVNAVGETPVQVSFSPNQLTFTLKIKPN
jgi:membrane-associated phospholipid phosphatase